MTVRMDGNDLNRLVFKIIKMPIITADMLNSRALPFCEKHNLPML